MRGFSITPIVVAGTALAALVAGASGCVGAEPPIESSKTDSTSTTSSTTSTTSSSTSSTTTATTCERQCANRNCGGDSCGGTCGSCPGGQTCSSSGECESPAPTGAAVGDPCTTNAQCASGDCLGEWCSASCTSDVSCGTASNGVQNRCIKNNENQSVCFPGCSTNATCASFSGTICESVNSGVGDICSFVGPPNYGNNPSCNTCLVQLCDSQEVACEQDSACVAFFACVEPCGTNSTCQQNCISPLATGTATTADNLLTCINSNCSSCGVPQ